ncbi:MAG: phage major capsid protein [Deltaproteobacteria bacterium]|nr:phage major capsid protein [Deltaproteobacteria bacterium]
MKTITEYNERLQELAKKLGDIRQNCIHESRDPNIDEVDLMNDIMDEMERIEKLVETLNRSHNTSDRLETSGRAKTIQDKTVDKDQEKKDRFGSLGEQLVSVMQASRPDGYVDPRLRTALVESRQTGMSISVPSDGGFLVQQDFANEIMREVFDTGLLASRCRRIPITIGNSMKIPGLDETSRVDGSRQGGVRGYWADEASEKTASKPKFRLMELNLHKLIGLVYLTDELMDDAPALESYVRQAFIDEFNFKVDDAIIEGTGAGQPLGIKNVGSIVQISKETGQTAATVVYENILKMWARLLPQAKADAVWLINTDVTPSLGTMSLAVGSGGSAVYIPPGGASASPYGTLMGKPIVEIEQCETLGTAGDIYLANFRRGYLLAEKGGIQSDMSIHVRFIYDESVFRFVLRLDGQPMLRSAITPFKGSNTLSHFVRVETRS